MSLYRHLMIGLTGANTDRAVIRYAAWLIGHAQEAEHGPDPIQIVHAFPDADVDEWMAPTWQAALRAHFRGVTHVGPMPAQVNARAALPLERLLAHAAVHDHDLLFLGHPGPSPQRRAAARRLGENAPCNVWLVPEDTPRKIRRILVPIDFSERAAVAMQTAVNLARKIPRARCLALHVYFNDALIACPQYDQSLQKAKLQQYEKFIAGIEHADTHCEPLLVEGAKVSHVIGRVAERNEIDLIVMAMRGRTAAATWVLGSVAQQTIVKTRVPLLLLRQPGPGLGFFQALLEKMRSPDNSVRFN